MKFLKTPRVKLGYKNESFLMPFVKKGHFYFIYLYYKEAQIKNITFQEEFQLFFVVMKMERLFRCKVHWVLELQLIRVNQSWTVNLPLGRDKIGNLGFLHFFRKTKLGLRNIYFADTKVDTYLLWFYLLAWYHSYVLLLLGLTPTPLK